MSEIEIILIGLNHRTAPVEVREKFSIPPDQVPSCLGEMALVPGFREGMILSTCNRVEVIGVMANQPDSRTGLMEFLARVGAMAADELKAFLYVHEGRQAVRHLFRVSASLDSMVIGEPQILGQVKEAYRQAVQKGVSGPILNKLFHRSFSLAKRIRTETQIANHAVSVSFAAVELARKILGNLDDKNVLLIGAGEMSELAARHFVSQGIQKMFITNRTFSRAEELAREFHGEALPFADFARELKRMDIVLSSTGSPHYLVHKKELSEIIRTRRNRPMFFIDIAVPRDIDPAINEIDNVYVYDIDDLQGIVSTNREERKKEIQRAEEIIEEGLRAFHGWLNSLEVVPTILALRHRLETIRQREVEKTLSFWKEGGEDQRKRLDVLTQSIINKILHHPVALLKRAHSQNHGKLYLEMTRKIFNLDEEEANEPKAS